ncbi:MAG: hypothetical protein A2X86_03510 [Bdellovibrionales bacterium GWA2_49_15]|nr:MAG: hypothetical protein A2X86_03510 [Bdellovibrionales bacterium GWA2_49_15]HAZ12283.1 hypothetical protein [Bdellovibrionales bacterium]
MELKILSFNIHKGMSWHSRNATLAELREFIRESQADLVFLQEVHGENLRERERMHNDFASQYEFLADEIWQHYCYAKNAVYDHGHHGNVILSKYPILEWHKQDISTNSWEQRGILAAKIEIPETKTVLQTYCVHLNLFPRSRVRQYAMLEKKIMQEADATMPLILAGDFNEWSRQATKTLEKNLQIQDCHNSVHGEYAKTFPALFPMLTLDRIYVKNVIVSDTRALRHLGISDHLPLMAKIEIN